MSQVLETHLQPSIQAVNPKRVIVEMGHIYLSPAYLDRDEVITDEEVQSIDIGLQVMSSLAELGIPLQSMLFVDDLHGFEDARGFDLNPELQENLQLVVSTFEEMGFTPDKVVSEAEMTSTAWYLYGLLKKKGVVNNGGRRLSENYFNAPLKNGSKDDERPSCSLIDAALYLTKLGPQNEGMAVTILHEKYKPQQLEVKGILSAYGLRSPNVTVVYYNDAGEVTEVDHWSQATL